MLLMFEQLSFMFFHSTAMVNTRFLFSLCVCLHAEIGDVTYHVDNNYVTTPVTSAAGVTISGSNVACDEDDDVDELSSSDVSSYNDVARNNNLTGSTDDNLASCR